MSCSVHVEAVPVQAGSFVAQRIVHPGDDLIPAGEVEHWRRPLTVDSNDGTGHLPIRISIHPGDVEVIVERRCRGQEAVQEEAGENKGSQLSQLHDGKR